MLTCTIVTYVTKPLQKRVQSSMCTRTHALHHIQYTRTQSHCVGSTRKCNRTPGPFYRKLINKLTMKDRTHSRPTHPLVRSIYNHVTAVCNDIILHIDYRRPTVVYRSHHIRCEFTQYPRINSCLIYRSFGRNQLKWFISTI